MSYPYKASCMADIFPLSYRQPKNQKNFVKENIKRLKEIKNKSSGTDSIITSSYTNSKGEVPFKSAVRSNNEFGIPAALTQRDQKSNRKPLSGKQKLTDRAKQLIEQTRSEINLPSSATPSSLTRSVCDKECQTIDLDGLNLDVEEESVTVAGSARSVGLQTDLLCNTNISSTTGKVSSNKIKKPSDLENKSSKDKEKIETKKKGNKVCSASQKQSVPESYQRGVVPRYIKEKKMIQEQEEAEKKRLAQVLGTDDPDCPEGHIRLPEVKRKETLQQIRDKYNNLVQELNGLPVRSDSFKIKKHRIFIEKELEKMEAGLKLFSREKLFVKIVS